MDELGILNSERIQIVAIMVARRKTDKEMMHMWIDHELIPWRKTISPGVV
jgi:hypothetical protein